MAYTEQTWNNEDINTPLSAARLNHMEAGIKQADTDANAPLDMAGLNTLGLMQGVFIENEGTLPADLPVYSLVIEQE